MRIRFAKGKGLVLLAGLWLAGCADHNTLPAMDGGGDGGADAGDGGGDGADDGGDGGEQLAYPVRVLFAVDCSGSTQVTDEAGRRVSAVQRFIAARADDAGWAFAVVKFNTLAVALSDGFERLSGDEAALFGPQGIGESDGLADVQGALGRAAQELMSEMAATADQALRGRTRYAVVLLADGVPSPICRPCVSAPPEDPAYDADCDAELQLVCKTGLMPDFEGECPGGLCGEPLGQAVAIDALPAGWQGRLEAGRADNDRPQLLELAERLVQMEAQYGAGAVELHTVYLDCFDLQGQTLGDGCAQADQAFGLHAPWARALYEDLAAAGDGVYLRAPAGQGLDLELLGIGPLGP